MVTISKGPTLIKALYMIEDFSLTITNCVEFKDHCTFCIQQIMYSWFSTFQMGARGRHLGSGQGLYYNFDT